MFVHSLHIEPIPSEGLVPFVEDTHEVTAGHRRGTRAFTRQHGDDLEPAKCLRLRRTRVPPLLEGEEEENRAVDPPSRD